ncbi:MAG TPA: hypothetical protein DHW82_02590 [Spirochaetia bacterium]|nr:MAG: hypothetical protein A2Y41_10460 [Spirochaetes bacterium GWB1_36_13]HCL55879.1 hypothetical protein [Spirochaetia bacterium]
MSQYEESILDKAIYISRKINSSYELPELLDSIMQTTTEIIKAEAASVLLVDENKKNLTFYSVTGEKKELIKQYSFPSDKGIAGHVFKNKQPVIVNDVSNDTRFYAGIDEHTSFQTKNLIAFPLAVKGDTIGVLEVINAFSPDGFNDYDLKVLSYITDLSSLAIYNRVLYDNVLKNNKITNKRVDELNALYSLLNTFSMSSDQIVLKDVFKKAAILIRDTVLCSRVSIFVKREKSKNVFELMSALGFEEKTLKEGEIVYLEKTRIMKMVDVYKKPIYVLNKKQSNFAIEHIQEKYSTESFISLPIMNNDEVIGFVNVSEKIKEDENEGFDDFDFSLIRSIAVSLGNIYNQYLLNQEKINQSLINNELENAALLQHKMLLQNFSIDKDFDIYGLNLPARNVSGDFFGFQKINQNELAAYIGDVSGKGLPAAFFMATASTSLKEKIRFYHYPKNVLKELNETLFYETQDGMFITIAYFLINKKERTFRYSFAGHNNQLLFKHAENKILTLKTHGKPIGIIPENDMEEAICAYETNDILLLFTDGVTEALVNNMEEEGEELLKQIIIEHHHLSSKELVALIQKTFIQEKKELFDDFTILIIKF